MKICTLILLILIATIAGSVIGSFAVLAWALSILHNFKGSRQR